MEPSKIEEIECRVDLIETLKRKYGNSLSEVLGFRESAHEKLNKTFLCFKPKNKKPNWFKNFLR